MIEALPILLGSCCGIVSAVVPRRSLRIAFAVGGTGCVALAAFLISGEFRESWAFGLLDLVEAAMGFAAGSIVALGYRISAEQK